VRSDWQIGSTVQRVGLVAAPLVAVLLYLSLPEGNGSERGQLVALTHAGRATAAVATWMAIWWLTEAIPVYATALLPLALLPLLGAGSIREVAAPYAHELIFLFMGGFIGLDQRIALVALRGFGTQPRRMVAGCMAVTAGLSMWVSNTATAVMMLPIALSMIGHAERSAAGEAAPRERAPAEAEERNFALCLLLGIAYAASIGGIGTLVGTPPNLFLASYIRNQLGLEVGFAEWMGIGMPLVVVFLPLVWLLLTRVLYPIRRTEARGGPAQIRAAYRRLGPAKPAEWVTLIVFSLTATFWISRPLLARADWGGVKPLEGLSDTGIAIIAALALFVIPLDLRKRVFVMDWETAVRLPWGLLVLFGGGLSLAAAIQANGVGEFLGNQVAGFAGLPSLLVVLMVTALMIFLTELTSNTATTAALVPILGALAPAMGLDPFALIVPAAIAASCAFMLPVATPPNAVIFGSGLVTIPQMCKAGVWLNLIGIVLITALTYAVALPLLTGGLAAAPGG
jgi:sodium-dependent dicarboxylate transporter 2/3/5